MNLSSQVARKALSMFRPVRAPFVAPFAEWRRPQVPGYPVHLVQHGLLPDGEALTIRPIKPQDRRLELAFLQGLSAQTRYQRLLSARKLLPGELHRLTHIDYRHEMALVALAGAPDNRQMIGVARYVRDEAGTGCDFAIVLADEFQRQGLGRRLLSSLLDAAQGAGLSTMSGITLASNQGMIRLARKLGFDIGLEPGDASVLRLHLEIARRRDGWFDL
jgi:acetyltransferase